MIKKIVAIVLLLLIALSTISADESYTPITDEEVLRYLNSITMDELVDDIQKLDAIIWSYPDITISKVAAVYTSDSVTFAYAEPITLEVAGHLSYTIRLEPVTFELPGSPFPWKTVGIASGVCFAGGIVLGLILAK